MGKSSKSIVIKPESERDKLVKVQFLGSMEFSMLTKSVGVNIGASHVVTHVFIPLV